MKLFRNLVLALGVASVSSAWAEHAPSRIVSLGAAVTETVYALGHGENLVGRDQTSLWPQAATHLPDVGYPRHLALEGIVSLLPDTVLASHDAGPPHVLQGLSNAGVNVVNITTGPSWDDAKAGMQKVAAQLGQQEALATLLAAADEDLAAAKALTPSTPKKLLFLLAEGPAGWMAAGSSTRTQTLIEALGAQNVMAQARGYRPLSAEALLALGPDAILIASHGLKQKSLQETLKSSGLEQVPAVKNGHVHVVDSSRYLTLGPRFGESVKALAQLLYKP